MVFSVVGHDWIIQTGANNINMLSGFELSISLQVKWNKTSEWVESCAGAAVCNYIYRYTPHPQHQTGRLFTVWKLSWVVFPSRKEAESPVCLPGTWTQHRRPLTVSWLMMLTWSPLKSVCRSSCTTSTTQPQLTGTFPSTQRGSACFPSLVVFGPASFLTHWHY